MSRKEILRMVVCSTVRFTGTSSSLWLAPWFLRDGKPRPWPSLPAGLGEAHRDVSTLPDNVACHLIYKLEPQLSPSYQAVNLKMQSCMEAERQLSSPVTGGPHAGYAQPRRRSDPASVPRRQRLRRLEAGHPRERLPARLPGLG